jgi:aspartyl-tRNA(Asn)/glutamyl-tRNA(Gln) amidotransferase subunit C
MHCSREDLFLFCMEINSALVDSIAHLARLHFTDEEKKGIEQDLQRMISFVEKLNELDTTGVEPLLHMSPQANVFREDEIAGSISREEALINAPATDGVFFKVPKVIKKQV